MPQLDGLLPVLDVAKVTDDGAVKELATALADIRSVAGGLPSGGVINYALLFDGTSAVWAPQGTTFSFSVASFSDGISAAQLIGPDANVWKAPGALTFSATFANGPADTASVQIQSGHGPWLAALALAGTTGPTASVEEVTYPSGPNNSITFRVTAAKGAASATRDEAVYFNNVVYWGHLNKASGYTEADIEALVGSTVLSSNTRARSINYSPAAGEYCVYAYPSRLGQATFTVNGFPGGFDTEELVSVTNSAGYTETYYVRVSDNPSLSAFTAVVT